MQTGKDNEKPKNSLTNKRKNIDTSRLKQTRKGKNENENSGEQ